MAHTFSTDIDLKIYSPIYLGYKFSDCVEIELLSAAWSFDFQMKVIVYFEELVSVLKSVRVFIITRDITYFFFFFTIRNNYFGDMLFVYHRMKNCYKCFTSTVYILQGNLFTV